MRPYRKIEDPSGAVIATGCAAGVGIVALTLFVWVVLIAGGIIVIHAILQAAGVL